MRTKTSCPAICTLILVASVLVLSSESEERPKKQPDFSEGFRAFKQKNWEEAADHMAIALKNRKEDGELSRVYGRWFEPYLPHFYLGSALLELGCYRAALDHFEATILNDQKIKGAKKQAEQLESLKLECEELLAQANDDIGCKEGSEEVTECEKSADCSRWTEELESEEGEVPNV